MILITGAAGKTGKAVLQALRKRATGEGQPVRALVRRGAPSAEVRQAGATDVVVGDLRNAGDLARACQGVQAIYHICPNMQPDEVAIGRAMLAAAQAQGVTRFVYHSVLHPQTPAMPHHWHKLQVEDLLFQTRLDYTILQPAAYLQNLLAGWQSIVNEGIYRIPYAVTTRLGMVDLADVAEVAALVLTTPGHSGATYELAGSEFLSQTAVAAILSDTLGRPVRAEAIPRATWEANARHASLSDYAIQTLLHMFDYYERYGFGGNSNVLRWLLGRTPTTLAGFVQRQRTAVF